MAAQTPRETDGGWGDGDPVEELVFQVLEGWSDEGPGLVDRLCAEHPELAEALRSRLATLRDAGLLGEHDDAAELPERLGEFRLLQRLGAGGMGVVHRAEQESLGRTVALKLVRPEQLFFPGARERFRREVEAAARLTHPGIVPVYTVGEDRGLPYFAMECVEGASLADVIEALAGRDPAELRGADMQRVVLALTREARDARDGEAPESDDAAEPSPVFAGTWVEACLRVVRQVAEALEHAHGRGVLHRDVKPSNIMLTPRGRAMLLDFGLSSLSGASRITRTGSHIGSLPYMSPERADGDLDDLGPEQDVYSLGVTLYELLTLRLPFEGESAEALRREIVAARPGTPRRHNRAARGDIESLVLVALDVDPARRFPSAEAFARDLSNVLHQRPLEVRRPGVGVRALRWAQRHPAAAVAVLLAVVLVVGGPLAWAVNEAGVNARLFTANESVQQANAQLRDALTLAEERRVEAEAQSRRAERERDAAEHARSVADAARLEAEDQRARADLERDRAEDEQQRAEAERDRAEANSRRALRAVELMLAQLGEDDLDGIPRVQPVRDRLLSHAVELYTELLAERPDDVELASEIGRLERVRGDVHRLMGDMAGAEEHLRAAIRRYDALLAGPGADDPILAILRAQVGAELAIVVEGRGRHDEARALSLENVGRWVEIQARLPGEPIVAHDLAASLTGLALRLRSDGQIADALLMLDEAVRVIRPVARDPRMEELISENTGLPTGVLRGGLSTALGLRALVRAQDLGELDGAERDLDEALALARGVMGDRPGDHAPALRLCELAHNGAEAVGFMIGDHERAEALAREGLQVALDVCAEYTDVPQSCKWVAGLRVVLGRLLLARGASDEAAALLDTAADEWADFVARWPENPQFAWMRGAALVHAGHAHMHVGDHPGAAARLDAAQAWLETWSARRPDDPLGTRNRFALHSLRAELLGTSGRFDEVEGELAAAQALRETHPLHAVALAGVLSTCADAAEAAERVDQAAAWRTQAAALLADVAPRLADPRMLVDDRHLVGLAQRGLLPPEARAP